MDKKRLYRTEGNYRRFLGVCGGLAEYFDVDPTVVRLVWAIGTLLSFSLGFWAYLICAVVIPNKSNVYPGY